MLLNATPRKRILFVVATCYLLTGIGLVLFGKKYQADPFGIQKIWMLYSIAAAASAIWGTYLYDKTYKGLALAIPKPKYIPFAFLIAIMLTCIPCILNLATEKTIISGQITISNKIILLGLPATLMLAVGEEIFWRGFILTQVLKIKGFRQSGFITGILYAVWQYPLVIFVNDLNHEIPLWFALVTFTIISVSFSFIANYLRIISRSIWPGIFLRGISTYIMFIFLGPAETVRNNQSAFYMHDTGIFYTLVYLVSAVLFTFFFYKSSVRKKIVHRRERLAYMMQDNFGAAPATETQLPNQGAGA